LRHHRTIPQPQNVENRFRGAVLETCTALYTGAVQYAVRYAVTMKSIFTKVLFFTFSRAAACKRAQDDGKCG
jgi:hypothetical protein